MRVFMPNQGSDHGDKKQCSGIPMPKLKSWIKASAQRESLRDLLWRKNVGRSAVIPRLVPKTMVRPEREKPLGSMGMVMWEEVRITAMNATISMGKVMRENHRITTIPSIQKMVLRIPMATLVWMKMVNVTGLFDGHESRLSSITCQGLVFGQ